MLGRGSVHASTIQGGAELSSYPARCVLGLERRTLPGESATEVERELEEMLDRCRKADDAFEARQQTLLVREPLETDPEAEIVKVVRESAAGVFGAPPPISGASYWADSAFIAAAGIPTVLFGPSGEGAHSEEEWVSMADTERVAQTLRAVAERFCV
jgi:acetylornithine deacetylase